MRTKEYIRAELNANEPEIHALLVQTTEAAQRVSERSLRLIQLPETYEPSHPIGSSDQRAELPRLCYGVLVDEENLALTAAIYIDSVNTIVLELRRDEIFPLVAEELMERLQNRFPGVEAEILAERPRISTGAPPLACNVWLEEQMSHLPCPEHYHHLYSTWLVHYKTLKGYEPVDPRRSFRAAAIGCLFRLSQKGLAQ